MTEYKICKCYWCEYRRVKQKITNYEWEVFIQKNKII